MVTLYYSPGACSLGVHVTLLEKQQAFNLKKVNLKDGLVEDGTLLKDINPKGYVPTLMLENGKVLTEAAAILSYLEAVDDPFERAEIYSALTFISSELHKGFSPFFNKATPEEYKDMTRARLQKRLDFVDQLLAKQKFIAGQKYTAADAYLFTILRWVKLVNTGLEFTSWPNIVKYYDMIAQRDAVKKALETEQLFA